MLSKLKLAMLGVAFLAIAMFHAGAVKADARERIRIPLGRSEVVTSDEEVRTIAIAEPKIADAAVGSQRTVVVSGKSVGITTLVMYGDAGRYRMYDVEVYTLNNDRQVLLHVRVAEVTDQAKKELGFDFYGTGVYDGVQLTGGLLTGKASAGPPPPVLNPGNLTDGFLRFTNKFGDLNFQTAWRALEEKGAIRVLANPSLLASSGDTASFLAGGEIPVPVAVQSSTGSGEFITIEWKEYGVRVAFRPTILEDGSLNLNVFPEVSQLDFNNAIRLSGAIIPALLSRKTNTTVQLKPGEHLVIGGLKQCEETRTVQKVPILGNIPILGFFLTHTRTDKVERELMIVVSPEILAVALPSVPTLPYDCPPDKK